jgi:hypothetical protein
MFHEKGLKQKMNKDEIHISLYMRRLVDVVSYIVLILLGVMVTRLFPVVGWAIIIWATFFYIYIQSASHIDISENQITILNHSYLGKSNITHHNLSLLPFFLGGFVHLSAIFARGRSYYFSRLISQGHILRCAPKVMIRGITECPRRQIILSQHVPGITDVFSVMMFTGGNDLTVIQDLGPSLHARAASHILAPIYGGVNIDRTDQESLRKSIDNLAESMKMCSCGSYVLWPSGSMWKKSLNNGIVDFRKGVFYLSIYSQIPVCLIHSRNDDSTLIVEKTIYIPPPVIKELPKNLPYREFINTPLVKDSVNMFKDRVEKMYRDLDNKLSKELNIT